jgi:lysine 6-dehydrogenase
MKIGVLGAGMQGSIVAQDLASAGFKVTVFDNNISRLRQLKRHIPIKAQQFNVNSKVKFIRLIKTFDLIVGALPAALGYYTMDCAIAAGVDCVDMSYAHEDPLKLHAKAQQAKVRIVPDAGFAPGLSNILVGETYQQFNGIDKLRILVGGVPQNVVPPFYYRITWSPTDLIEEYTRPARIIKNKENITVEALTGIETVTFPKVGKLECFYTDGLRTLLSTIKNVESMEEKTIRYPGHAELFKTIIKCGFFSDQQVRCRKQMMPIKSISTEYLRVMLSQGDEQDISIMEIDIKKGKNKRTYRCIDYYDAKSGITSMARMTAYTSSIIAQCVKHYPEYGVIPPEYLGMNRKISQFIKNELKKRKITITTSKS